MSTQLAVSATTRLLASKAEELAAQLHLPFAAETQHYDYLLQFSPEHLSLVETNSKTLPLYVDFLSGKITYRRKHATLRNEILARALGLKTHMQPKIVDATAGLARDSFILASLGFEICILERSPIIFALVANGLSRAQQDTEVKTIVDRLTLIQADAIHWLKNAEPPDIIYLDPMFPERQKSALVKKEMRIFQAVIGPDVDEALLLETALACAKKRVVVKRPRLAKPIKGPMPSFNLTGSSSRFDIYLI